MRDSIKLARWWKALDDDSEKIECFLCPHHCHIAEDKTGICGVRKNIGGQLYSMSYGRPVATNIDPIEKKPINEYMSGTDTFSIGTFGCNLNCLFCQNASLACSSYDDYEAGYMEPEMVVNLAKRYKCPSISFTYNEPTVFAEYAIDIAAIAHEEGLKTILVTNGFITIEAARELYPFIDAANFDMKGFSEDFYWDMTGSHLDAVLESMKYFFSLGKHLEITNLVIPAYNDSELYINNFLDWVENNLSKDVPLHFSAFFPAHKMSDAQSTPPETILRIIELSQARGFRHCYSGNLGLRPA